MQSDPHKNKDEADSVHELEEKLYARGDAYDFNAHRAKLSRPSTDLPQGSGLRVTNTVSIESMDESPRKGSWVKWLLLGSLAFFVLALGIVALFFAQGSRSVSAENIEMSINGPVSVKGGEVLDIAIVIQNNNAVPLEFVDLSVEFPEGSRNPADQSIDLSRTRESIGTIAPGEAVSKVVRAVLFGEDNAQKEIVFNLDYRFGNSNIIASKSKAYEITLSSSPVSISVSGPSEVTSNQTIELVVKTTSNALTPLANVLLDVRYPPGFLFASAEPAVYSSNHVWNLGTLAPGKEKTVRIKGVIEGQDDELKAFRVLVGAEAKSEGVVGIPYGTVARTLSVKRPALAGNLVLGGSENKEISVPPASRVTGTLSLENNIAAPITDARIQLRVTGAAFDRSSLQAIEAFFDSKNNTVLWDKSTDEKLASVDPGGTLDYPFSFDLLPTASVSGAQAGIVDLEVTVTGDRFVPGIGTQEVTSSFSRRIKLASEFDLLPRIIYYGGPFVNKGPLPPRAEQETTYTVVWSLSNSSNDLSRAEVRAKLPAYVRFSEKISPATENVTFDIDTREVLWNVGDVKAGTGYKLRAKEVSFQIALTPGLGQVGSEPDLVGEVSATARDNFTNTDLASIKRALTTVLTSDARFRPEDGQVVK